MCSPCERRIRNFRALGSMYYGCCNTPPNIYTMLRSAVVFPDFVSYCLAAYDTHMHTHTHTHTHTPKLIQKSLLVCRMALTSANPPHEYTTRVHTHTRPAGPFIYAPLHFSATYRLPILGDHRDRPLPVNSAASLNVSLNFNPTWARSQPLRSASKSLAPLKAALRLVVERW